MELFSGRINNQEAQTFFQKALDYHLEEFKNVFKDYDALNTFKNWHLLIYCIDEFINIPSEIKNEKDREIFLKFNLNDLLNENKFSRLITVLKNNFLSDSVKRCFNLCIMLHAINEAYKINGIYAHIPGQRYLTSLYDCIIFLQSRRAYITTTLHLIPKVCKGKNKFDFLDTLNLFLYPVETCCINVTTHNRKILLARIFEDYTETSNGFVSVGNYHFEYLEGFFFEPERLSIVDMVELRPVKSDFHTRNLPTRYIFSFEEMLNSIDIIEHSYSEFGLSAIKRFASYKQIAHKIGNHVKDHYWIEITLSQFVKILSLDNHAELLQDFYEESYDYYDNINSIKPFILINGILYSNVVLFTRFFYNKKNELLKKQKRYQIHSGFIFEDKVTKILESNGYVSSHITRINNKEFDLIMTKNGEIHNFQCKNNEIDTYKVFRDNDLLVRYNSYLNNYYKKAYKKEVDREKLIQGHLKLTRITHYVVSRFPVISNLDYLIRYNELEEWASQH